LEFETIETQIVFGPNKKIENILPRQRNDAHKIIEECMLCANVCASKFLAKHKIPALYRVHEGPKAEKLDDLRGFLSELGLKLQGGEKPKPKDYAEVLLKIAHREDFDMIQTVLLRSLSQAVYTPDNKGHFGLAYDCYAHFTSPIRRYPDLLVHRAIRHLIQNNEVQDFDYSQSDMGRLGEHCSLNERRADDATRDVTDWLKCEYMLDKVGEEFTGIITGVTNFGLFVQLESIYVEGLVHISELPQDYYDLDSKHHCLRGQRSGKVFKLTDKMRVLVANVNLDDRRIDFVMVSE
jgi:ribonuclease R